MMFRAIKREGDMPIEMTGKTILALVLVGGTALILVSVLEPRQMFEAVFQNFMSTLAQAIPLPIDPPSTP